ncbi:MAG: hypothetical protein ACM30G_20220 [Micromonosporaceae bacterium]
MRVLSAADAGAVSAGAEAGWVTFRRSDATAVIGMVRAVAAGHDAGEHGDGVEVVVETPRPGWLARRLGRQRAQARMVVTKGVGIVAYPFDIQLVTEHDGAGAHRVGARRGWATSNSAGLAFLIQKGREGDRFDFAGLVGGAVAALSTLRPRARDNGWRARVDRSISRH